MPLRKAARLGLAISPRPGPEIVYEKIERGLVIFLFLDIAKRAAIAVSSRRCVGFLLSGSFHFVVFHNIFTIFDILQHFFSMTSTNVRD
jgi:hypothetical protein